MKNFGKFAALLFLVSFAINATAKEEHLLFSLGLEWNPVRSPDTPKSTVLELIRAGDDINNWKELVTVQNFAKSRNYRHPAETLDALKEVREKTCPGVTEWTVIDQSEDSILYEWHAKECQGEPEQHEVARILYGKHNVFFLHYAAKVHELAPETREKWIKKFSSVSIETK